MKITLDEAIVIIAGMIEWKPGYLKENERRALKLGIEAMTLLRLLKASGDIRKDLLLKGETEE